MVRPSRYLQLLQNSFRTSVFLGRHLSLPNLREFAFPGLSLSATFGASRRRTSTSCKSRTHTSTGRGLMGYAIGLRPPPGGLIMAAPRPISAAPASRRQQPVFERTNKPTRCEPFMRQEIAFQRTKAQEEEAQDFLSLRLRRRALLT